MTKRFAAAAMLAAGVAGCAGGPAPELYTGQTDTALASFAGSPTPQYCEGDQYVYRYQGAGSEQPINVTWDIENVRGQTFHLRIQIGQDDYFTYVKNADLTVMGSAHDGSKFTTRYETDGIEGRSGVFPLSGQNDKVEIKGRAGRNGWGSQRGWPIDNEIVVQSVTTPAGTFDAVLIRSREAYNRTFAYDRFYGYSPEIGRNGGFVMARIKADQHVWLFTEFKPSDSTNCTAG